MHTYLRLYAPKPYLKYSKCENRHAVCWTESLKLAYFDVAAGDLE